MSTHAQNPDAAVVVEKVHKSFRLPHDRHSGIKQLIVNFYKPRRYEKQQVLKGLSFEIKKGEFFGIVGRNGSGKSTLLKLLAGIYTPDSGRVHVEGLLTPFIELGVGFNPELTGRENVYLNGALLGFNRKEMGAMYEEIVAFAELEKFMDQKLKNYSSGMQVRLAFSIAIRARSDILLIDEVLAVGDSAFQKKCFEHFVNLKKSDATVILVTHDMSAVERFCDRALVVHDGVSHGVMKPVEAARLYNKLNAASEEPESETEKSFNRWGTGGVKIKRVSIQPASTGRRKAEADHGKKLTLEVETRSDADRHIVIGLAFIDQYGVNIAGPNSIGVRLKSNGVARFQVEHLPLVPGVYDVTVAVFDADVLEEFDHYEKALRLHVSADRVLHGKVDLFGSWRQQ